MASGKQAALSGVAARLAGRRASRLQAMAAAAGAAIATYRLLRSGGDDGDGGGDSEPDAA